MIVLDKYHMAYYSLRSYAFSFENICAGMICATNWHEGSVIPAKAGIHPLPRLDAGLRRHDGSMNKPMEGWRGISYSADDRKVMNTLRSIALCLKSRHLTGQRRPIGIASDVRMIGAGAIPGTIY